MSWDAGRVRFVRGIVLVGAVACGGSGDGAQPGAGSQSGEGSGVEEDDSASNAGDGSGGDGDANGEGEGGAEDGSAGGDTGANLPPITATEGACKEGTSGKYALRTSIDVWWGMEGSVTRPGRGDVVTYLLSDNTSPDAGNNFTSTIQVCKVEIPTFVAGPICEAYLAEFGTWASVPTVTSTGRFGCFEPGCPVGLGPLKVFAGITLDDANGPWPTPSETATFSCGRAAGAGCFPDHDQDGKPGMTGVMRIGGVYKQSDPTCLLSPDRVYAGAPPATLEALLPGAARVKELYLGVRTLLDQTSFELDENCAMAGGVGVPRAVNSRALSCSLTDGRGCNDAQETYVDEKLPAYTPLGLGERPPARVGTDPIDDQSDGRAARVESVRLGDATATVTCADVLAAFP